MFMAKTKKTSKKELLSDYRLLGKMSDDLSRHQKNVKAITKNVARHFKSNLRLGLIESLAEISEHMQKAQKELDKAKKELGRI